MSQQKLSNEVQRRALQRGRERLRRRHMQAKGYRRITLWVPDARQPRFEAEVQQHMARIAEAEKGPALIDQWLDSQDTAGWTRHE